MKPAPGVLVLNRNLVLLLGRGVSQRLYAVQCQRIALRVCCGAVNGDGHHFTLLLLARDGESKLMREPTSTMVSAMFSYITRTHLPIKVHSQ